MPQTFATRRLYLRPFGAADAPAIVPLLNDAEMCRGLTVVPFPYTLSDAQWFVSEGAQDALAVTTTDGVLVGAMGLGKQLGYWIGKAYWGHGFATEAAEVVLQDHFSHSDTTVFSGFAAWNLGSANVQRKLGFKVIGDKMLHIKSLNKEVPAKSVALTAQDWQARA